MNVTKLNSALDAFVKADGNASTSALAYIALAIRAVYNGDAKVEDLIETICDKTKSRGSVTKDFPKGKANPNALKANGFSGLAEASRLLAKIGKKPEETRPVVEAFLGVIQSPVAYRAARNADKRVRSALASKAVDRSARIRKALRDAATDYLAITYPDRPVTFNGLRSALDKATASKKSQEALEAPAPANDGDTGEGEGEISANAVHVAKADVLANATISEMLSVCMNRDSNTTLDLIFAYVHNMGGDELERNASVIDAIMGACKGAATRLAAADEAPALAKAA